MKLSISMPRIALWHVGLFILFMLACVVNGASARPATIPIEARYANINGIKMHYLDSGKGDILLLLHGYPFFASSWKGVIDAFSQQYRVIAPDNRGYNLTEKPVDISDYHIDVCNLSYILYNKIIDLPL